MRVDFREGDAEALPAADESFAATLSVFGTMFAPDHRKTAAEVIRVTEPGGTIALVERFATYYGPTLKALDAAGTARDALLDDLRKLALAWNRLAQPGPIAVPGTYLESVGVRV